MMKDKPRTVYEPELFWKCRDCGKVYRRDYFGGFVDYVSLEEETAYVLRGFHFGDGICQSCHNAFLMRQSAHA